VRFLRDVLFARPDELTGRATSKEAKRKGRRALRRRPFLATAGTGVRFRCDFLH
jgi:hypothetical protein